MSKGRLATRSLKVPVALVALVTIVASSEACSESDLAPNASQAPPQWPLAMGDMVDGRTMHATIDRFKDVAGYGMPQFTRVAIKAPENTRERRYACFTSPPAEEARTDVFARRVGDRQYMVRALPEGTACDLEGLYVDRWVYEGHS